MVQSPANDTRICTGSFSGLFTCIFFGLFSDPSSCFTSGGLLGLGNGLGGLVSCRTAVLLEMSFEAFISSELFISSCVLPEKLSSKTTNKAIIRLIISAHPYFIDHLRHFSSVKNQPVCILYCTTQ
jgi:surfactin synthase thioesterase subunit